MGLRHRRLEQRVPLRHCPLARFQSVRHRLVPHDGRFQPQRLANDLKQRLQFQRRLPSQVLVKRRLAMGSFQRLLVL